MYKLRVSDDTKKLVQTMHPRLKKKVKGALGIILSDPYSGKGLKDELAGLRSFKVSRLRIIYRVSSQKKHVEIVTIGPRDSIYEETFRIITKETKAKSKAVKPALDARSIFSNTVFLLPQWT